MWQPASAPPPKPAIEALLPSLATPPAHPTQTASDSTSWSAFLYRTSPSLLAVAKLNCLLRPRALHPFRSCSFSHFLFTSRHPDKAKSSPPIHPATSQTHPQTFPTKPAPQTKAPDSTAQPSITPSSAPKSRTFAAHRSPGRSHP